MITRVFVYGSLMRGMGNHRVIGATGTFEGKATSLATFSMVSLGAFPGIIFGGSTPIAGETYLIDDATLANLDRMEGHPHFYCRTEIALDDGTLAQAYLLPRGKGHEVRDAVLSGDWRAFYARKEESWRRRW